MNRLLPAALLFFAAAFLANPAWSFQGFGLFEQIQHSIECARKPGADYLTCSNKLTPADEEEEVTSTEPEPIPEPTPVPREPQYDLYNHDVTELMGLIDFPGCEHPSPSSHVKFMLDVDLDGDQDAVQGFDCITFTQDADDLKEQLTFDEFFGWIADSYLAVFMNDNGEFRNDQSIFDGEYPVYDKTLKSRWPINVGDVNGDGYADMVIAHHWDNSRHDAINNTLIPGCDLRFCPTVVSTYLSAGSVMISDGIGGYKAHLLPMQTWQSVPQFYTDELGDTYVWIFSEDNTFRSGEGGIYDDYQKRELDLEVRPYVGKVSGADLIDVTDRYWEKLYNTNPRGNSEYCYIARDMAVNGRYQGHAHYTWEMPCSNPENWLPTGYAVEQLAGKVYVNTARNINHNQIYTGDHRIAHCKGPDWDNQSRQEYMQERQCVLDASTNQPWMFDSLAVLAMDSERGVYIQDTHQHTAEFRYYLNDPGVPVSQGGDYEALFFIHMGDRIQLNVWGWGVTIAEEQSTGDVLAMSNMGGVMLDQGATIDDVEELANFILREFDPRTGDWSNSILDNIATSQRNLQRIMEAGFCPDVLEAVEPEDCRDPAQWSENLADRYQFYNRDYGRSVGHRVSQEGVIVSESKLTNLNMAVNNNRTQLIDFDSDGDLDLYINDNSANCGALCLYENLGDYEFELNLEGIWAQVDDVYWEIMRLQIMGGRNSNKMSDIQRMLFSGWGAFEIGDVDGDGILDFYGLKKDDKWGGPVEGYPDGIWDYNTNLTIIYGE